MLNPAFIKSIKKLGDDKSPDITFLDKLNIGPIESINAEELKALFEMVGTHPYITHLDLSNLRIDNEGVQVIAEFLKSKGSGHVTHLNLKNNHISQTGVIALADAFTVNSTLEECDLAGNGNANAISTIEEIAERLPKMKLKTFVLEDDWTMQGNARSMLDNAGAKTKVVFAKTLPTKTRAAAAGSNGHAVVAPAKPESPPQEAPAQNGDSMYHSADESQRKRHDALRQSLSAERTNARDFNHR